MCKYCDEPITNHCIDCYACFDEHAIDCRYDHATKRVNYSKPRVENFTGYAKLELPTNEWWRE